MTTERDPLAGRDLESARRPGASQVGLSCYIRLPLAVFVLVFGGHGVLNSWPVGSFDWQTKALLGCSVPPQSDPLQFPF